jgi:hypothetical protein
VASAAVATARHEADVVGGVGLLVIARGHRDHRAAEHPAEGARLAPIGELDPVAKQFARRPLMLAAVPFRDPNIERPAPADRAGEGIERCLETDRMRHDPGEGNRRLPASADQLLKRQHRADPRIRRGDPIRRPLLGLFRAWRRLQIIEEPHPASVAPHSAPQRRGAL